MKSILYILISLFSLINISNAQVIYVYSANEWDLSNAISNASNGDTIMFDLPSYPATISITSGFFIGNKKISIIGPQNQNVTLVGEGFASQIFYINNGADIEIKNLTLTRQSGVDNNFGQSLIFNSGTLRINNCLLRNVVNSTAQGAVIYNAWSGNLFLRNSTLSENYGGQGGAIFSTGNLDIESCTFNENYADNVGGGVFWHGNGGFFNCRNSIFKNSTCFKYSRVINSLGYNVSNDGSYGFNACSDFNNVSSIFLNPLQDNGGSTKTHSLNHCSIALNNGDPSITENDQRDLPVYGGVRDIGAYEAQSDLHSIPQSIDTRTECSPFIWIDGNTYTSNNNCSKYFLVGQGANGCDSLVTLNLIINGASYLTSIVTAPTASAQTFCTSVTVANLVATGTAIKWYATATGGSALPNTTSLVSGTTYYASQTLGTCESTRTAVAVTITQIEAPTASAQTFCASTTVASLVATGTSIKWYAASRDGAALASNTALLNGTTYYASQTNGDCESSRTAVAVSIIDPQIASSANSVCPGESVTLSVGTSSATATNTAGLSGTLQNGIMAFYPFDGNNNDVSLNGNNPTLTTVQYAVDRNGITNSAGLFLGNEYAIVPNSSSFNVSGSFSIASWAYLNTDFPLTGWWNTKALFSKDNDYPYGAKVFITPDADSLHVSFGTNVWDINQSFGKKFSRNDLLGAWHHFAFIYENNQGKLFLDGTLVISQTCSPNWSSSNNLDLHIGVNGDPAGNYPYKFIGKMDDLGFWNRSLNTSVHLK